jgi:hypothetical protein
MADWDGRLSGRAPRHETRFGQHRGGSFPGEERPDDTVELGRLLEVGKVSDTVERSGSCVRQRRLQRIHDLHYVAYFPRTDEQQCRYADLGQSRQRRRWRDLLIAAREN